MATWKFLSHLRGLIVVRYDSACYELRWPNYKGAKRPVCECVRLRDDRVIARFPVRMLDSTQPWIDRTLLRVFGHDEVEVITDKEIPSWKFWLHPSITIECHPIPEFGMAL